MQKIRGKYGKGRREKVDNATEVEGKKKGEKEVNNGQAEKQGERERRVEKKKQKRGKVIIEKVI